MSTNTKRLGIIEIFKNMFSSEPDIEDYEAIALPEELKRVQESIDEKSVVEAFNSGKSSKGGFAKKINPKTEEAMRAMHNRVVKRETQDREIGD